ncbi:LPS export ABC transporter periplasmic protein LptC [Ancylobacter sp. G4_0304]|uniref:LPS export ABC transporter periplasmic protein LptC n=1 Tax=Ancylobacter sp. G4_0304 TaxID=3114289 RepID=UPI0039C75D60
MNRYVQPPEQAGTRPARAGTGPAAPRPGQGAASGGRRADAAFKAARRNSRFVRFLRVALPAGVLIVLGLTVLASYIDPLKLAVNLPFDLGRISLSGSRIKMEFPKLQGFTADNRGYSVTAQSASQDLTNTSRVDLEQIEAKVELPSQGWATLSAKTGRYDTKQEQIVLSDGVRFGTDAGYGGKLEEAAVDIKSGKITSDRPVELTYQDGSLTADRMEISQKDSRALFTGNVRLNFKMPPPGDDKAEPPALRGTP